MTPEQKKLADKIVALLALASSTTFAAEAETARRLADELMAKHKIEQTALGGGKPSQDTIEVREYWTPRFCVFASGETAKWHSSIVMTLVDFCSCAYVYRGDYIWWAFIGTIWNLDILEYMLSEIGRQRQTAWLSHKRLEEHDSFHRFCFGFAESLKSKIDAIIDHDKVRQSHTALIIWYESKHGKVAHGDGLHLGRASSEAGIAAGKDASLHRGAVGA